MSSNKRVSPRIFVFAGTIAEFIKLAPVIRELQERKIQVRLIASGQNDITKSDLLPLVKPDGVDIWILRTEIRQTVLGLFTWFLRAFFLSIWKLRHEFRSVRDSHEPVYLLVHGDTISTLIGAVAGWFCGAKICHVEAGLRSFNLFRPFPEEMCRVVVSRLASIAFCPNEWAMGNLRKQKRLRKCNTKENTLIDALSVVRQTPRDPLLFSKIPEKYFIFVLHRQENLLDRDFSCRIVQRMIELSKEIPCVMILHEPTRVALEGMGILESVLNCRTIIGFERLPYIAFSHLLMGASFIVTDGGSNQEESYFLGKPCLVLRKETERKEGLDWNVLLSMKDFDRIEEFLVAPEKLGREAVIVDVSPSKLIVNTLMEPS